MTDLVECVSGRASERGISVLGFDTRSAWCVDRCRDAVLVFLVGSLDVLVLFCFVFASVCLFLLVGIFVVVFFAVLCLSCRWLPQGNCLLRLRTFLSSPSMWLLFYVSVLVFHVGVFKEVVFAALCLFFLLGPV